MKRYATLTFLLGAFIVASATNASAQVWGRAQVPQAGVCFYENIDFDGRYFCVPVGGSIVDVPAGTNDLISSIRFVGNVEVMVFRDRNFMGDSRRFIANVSDLRRSGWNDIISSIRVAPRAAVRSASGETVMNPPVQWGRGTVPSAGACFYQHANFGGQYFCATEGTSTAEVPRIGNDPNDSISSVRVFGGTEVTVFRAANFGGLSFSFNADMPSLEQTGWNDLVSSFRVGTRPMAGAGGGSAAMSGGGGFVNQPAQWGRGAQPQTGACFYQHENFGGQYFCTNAGASAAEVPLVTKDPNDRISSVRVFGGAEVTVFRATNFGGQSFSFDADIPNLEQAGWNDLVASLRVGAPTFGRGNRGFGGARGGGRFGRGNDTGLEVFSDVDFGGQSAMFTTTTPNLGASGMAGTISSLRVAPGQSWQVCTEPNFQGRCQVVTGEMTDLRPGQWSDVIQSVRRLK